MKNMKKILLGIGFVLILVVIFFWYFIDKRQQLLSLYCTVGDMNSCYLLGHSYKRGNSGICSNAPQSVLDNAVNTIQSEEKAKEAFTKACNGGYHEACTYIKLHIK